MLEYSDFVRHLTARHAELAKELAPFHSLESVFGWMKARGIPLSSLDLVTQDEFHHDVLIPLGTSGEFLAFGTT
jgi:hypothetical protein